MMQGVYSPDYSGQFAELTSSDLLEKYKKLINKLIAHMKAQINSVIDADDLYQIACMSLLQTYQDFDGDETYFPAFAWKKMRWAILDECRRLDWRGRQSRQSYFELDKSIRDLENQLGHHVSEAEICASLHIDSEAYENWQQASLAADFASLDELIQTGISFSDEGEACQRQELQLALKQALCRLSSQEQTVLQLYYEYDLNLKEIALVLDLSEARVCQINKKALQKLKNDISIEI